MRRRPNLAAEAPRRGEGDARLLRNVVEGLEPTLNEFVPISIGAKQQPVVELTSGDWEGIYADNTGYVREAVGGPTGGHWHIKVEEAGEYEFTLRRWPEQTQAALGEKYEPSANRRRTRRSRSPSVSPRSPSPSSRSPE